MAFTYFFRDLPVIEHAVEHAVRFASGMMRFKVWDAGSAMGQETYTIAIILAEKMGKFAFNNLRLTATDYDSANHFGDTVQKAVYHYDKLKRMPPEFFDKYFEPADKPSHHRVTADGRLPSSHRSGSGIVLDMGEDRVVNDPHDSEFESY